MRNTLDTLRKIALAVLAVGVILSGVERSTAATHDIEHQHEATVEAPKGSEHSEASTSSCHGVLLCHAAVALVTGDPTYPDTMRGLRHRRHSSLLSHLAHPAFDPPPPRPTV